MSTTLHAQLVVSEEGRAMLQHLQPGQHLNITFQIAPPDEVPHASAHDLPAQEVRAERATFSQYHRPEEERHHHPR